MAQISSKKIKPAIVGGGIGGLTLSIALHKHGIDSDVYESTPEIKPVGAGILLASNAMQVYKRLGIYEKIAESGNRVSTMNITTPDLKTLSSINLEPFEKKYGVHNVSIHRGALQECLMSEATNVHLDAQLKSLQEDGDGFLLDFGNKEITADCVIGADGIHSKVRDYVDPNGVIRDAGQICWRGITEFDLPKEYHHTSIEAWGKGSRFGMNQVSRGRVYWYALVDSNLGTGKDLSELFKAYNPLVREVIASTDEASIIENGIIDLKPIPKWSRGKVCLTGDAAHATTPNMGQGACQAIEDAWVLAEQLAANQDIGLAFAQFEAIRRQKALMVVNRSWSIGKISHLRNPFLMWLRNTMMRMTPSSAGASSLKKIFEID